MPITSRVNGDLIKLAKKGKYEAIVHGCNCFNTMGSGLAPQIARSWPGAQEADNKTIPGSKVKLGNYTNYWDDELDLFIFNLYRYTLISSGTAKYA